MKKGVNQGILILLIIGMFIIIIGISAFMTLKNTDDLEDILGESIKSGLISTSVAARGLLDVDRFEMYNSPQDVLDDYENYSQTLEALRALRRQTGVTYIYALKRIDGAYYFVFDTDEETDTLFDEYEIYPVHEQAFNGEETAGIMNVVDEYGSFNTGAVPLWKNGRIIGIISTDIEDTYVQQSDKTSTRNAIALILTLGFAMSAMTIMILLLLRNVRKMQNKLFQMANYDVLTGLPNRQFLMNYLPKVADVSVKKQSAFAFLLIDLDNFKSVNDNAGHDSGDDVLRIIASYLRKSCEDPKPTKRSAGLSSISARIGGDEFVQIVLDVPSDREAKLVAEKLLDNFRIPELEKYIDNYQVGMSIGVALFPHHTGDFNALIKYADIAMYHAKRSGKNAWRLYSADMSEKEAAVKPAGQEPTTPDRRQYRR